MGGLGDVESHTLIFRAALAADGLMPAPGGTR
jgi:hypothetical protein